MSLDSNTALIRQLFSDVLNRANPVANNQIVSHYDEVNPYSFLIQTNTLPKP